MSIDYQKLRLDGIYLQDETGHLMLRVKLAAGVLSSTQAETIGGIAHAFSNGILHLTSRGSIEFHWLKLEQLPEIFRQLAATGLSSRGACGGAVRGISCSTTFNLDFALVQNIARKLNRHFMGNPYFEGLPKKFKIAVDAGYEDSRHLIQDIGLVFAGIEDEQPCFDVWCAGGLGREPQAAFLLEKKLAEHELIPLIEAVVQVYRDNTPPPKRLKYLLNQIGENEFRSLLLKDRQGRPQPAAQSSLDDPTVRAGGAKLEVPVFAGELPASTLLRLAHIARTCCGGFLAVTANQNIALLLTPDQTAQKIREQLASEGFFNAPETKVAFRICPGNHECRMGLVATRDVSRQLIAGMGTAASKRTWAISGCANSCSQPQLAHFGILSRKLVSAEDGSRTPRFDLLRRDDPGQLGEIMHENMSLAEVQKFIDGLN